MTLLAFVYKFTTSNTKKLAFGPSKYICAKQDNSTTLQNSY
jgi:hypothetical protein